MIIEVSDDESNGSDMDIDNEDIPSKWVDASPALNQQRHLSGSLPNFPSRPTSAFPGSSAVSTPGPQTPSAEAREQEMKKKQDELAAMKARLQKKLAEKREKDREAAAAALALRKDVSKGASDLIQDVKRRRREEIESKLPSIESELATNASRMHQLMKEMEELKVQNEKITKDKELLTRELESLGVDTEGMSHAEMQAKKSEIEHELSPEREIAPRDSDPSLQATASASIDASQSRPVEEIQETMEIEAAPAMVRLQKENRVNEAHAMLPGLGSRPQQVIEGAKAPSQASTVDEIPNVEAVATLDEVPRPTIIQEHSEAADLAAPARNAVSSISGSAAGGAQDSATPLDEEDDFYSPAPAAEPKVEQSIDAAAPAATAPSPSEEGEVEMSVSSEDEEEYEPEEPTTLEDMPVQEAQVPNATTTQSLASEDVSTEDEEAYEPPDVGDVVSNAEADSVDIDVDAVAPQAEEEDGAMDIASSSSSDSDSDSEGEISSEPEKDATISESHALHDTANIADDLAPELQPELAPEAVRPLPTV
jgi:hypothetical protein